jgi:uncharacterized protein with ParB-like and HNH nuclease domain
MSNEMSAERLTVSDLLPKSVFHIPFYQRPYSWGVEDCDALWNDLVRHFESDPESPYFLGVIVLATNTDGTFKIKDNTDSPFDVIDGQQRLTTLSLLLRALLIEGDSAAMKRCLYRLNEETDDVISIRIKSDVFGGQEQEQLEQWLNLLNKNNEPEHDSKVIHESNYAFFRKQIADWLKDDPEKRKAFAAFIRNNVILLRVKCQDERNALTIFETINNRGKNLTNGDIFKAKIAQMLKNKEEIDDFSMRWDSLVNRVKWLHSRSESSITLLFRYYMHLLRGQEKDKDKVVGLRDFFDGNVTVSDKKNKKVKKEAYILTKPNWTDTMSHLEGLADALSILNETEDTELRIWQYILNSFNNDIWKYPVVIFLYKNIKAWEDITTREVVRFQCSQLMHNIARYIFAKGFGGNTIAGSSIEDEMFAVIIKVMNGEFYTPQITVTDQFMQKLDSGLTMKYRRGFCSIIEFAPPGRIESYRTNKDKDTNPRKHRLERTDVEHILPKNWEKNNYHNWTIETVRPIMDTIGNLLLLEESLNRGGTDNFFSKKLNEYSMSVFSEPRNLYQEASAKDNVMWTYEVYQTRQNKCKEILRNFFEGKYIPDKK